jgi:Predicted metal-dependent phosphoesterases (PHP family)
MPAGETADRTRRRRRDDPRPAVDPVVPPGPSLLDLHTHSLRSDGVLEPGDLVGAAAACGVRTLVLTDHDTLAGYRELVADDAIPPDVELIPGVEINALVMADLGLWEGELHILGFGMDPADEAFEAILAEQRDRRRLRFARTVERLRELSMPIDAQVEELTPGADDALGRPTIGRALMAAGFATSVEDAFARLIGHGKPGYVPRDGLQPAGAIAALFRSGGLAVLAHFSEAPDRLPIIRELIAAGLGGLEVYYRAFDRATVAALVEVAADERLVATGGSDYHGDTGTYAEAHAALWVPPIVADDLRAAGVMGPAAP